MAEREAPSRRESVVRFALPREDGGGEVVWRAAPGSTLLEAAREAGVPLDAPCGGRGSCGKCRVRLSSGAEALTCDHAAQRRHIGEADWESGWRLACLSSTREGEYRVEIPAASLDYQSRSLATDIRGEREKAAFDEVRRSLEESGCFAPASLKSSSGLASLTLTLTPPSEGDSEADSERLLSALKAAAGVSEARIALSALRRLPDVLRESGFKPAVVFRYEEDGKATVLNTAEAPLPLAGLALDIGTTTVSGLLVDLATGAPLAAASTGNAQCRYGADVISRIIESEKPGGLERLRQAITDESLTPLIKQLCAGAGLPPEALYRAALAANTTMAHLFLGVPPKHLRLDPYVPAFFAAGPLRAVETGLPTNPEAHLVLPPAVGSYVGADISAGVFASGLWRRPELSLFIDLGTNGEVVLGGQEYLLACACSAGPAFEGGEISCGMRAAPGAIEALNLDSRSLEPTLQVIGQADGQEAKPAGLCGSGLLDTIAALFREDIINGRGKFIREGPRILRGEWGEAAYLIAGANESATGADIALTETDIDAFIRAKAAIYAAIRTMLTTLDLTPAALDTVYISGGIGSALNIEGAIEIGMLPDIPRQKYRYIGNSALLGAYAALVSREAATRTATLAAGITYLELSTHPDYLNEFTAAAFLPPRQN